MKPQGRWGAKGAGELHGMLRETALGGAFPPDVLGVPGKVE